MGKAHHQYNRAGGGYTATGVWAGGNSAPAVAQGAAREQPALGTVQASSSKRTSLKSRMQGFSPSARLCTSERGILAWEGALYHPHMMRQDVWHDRTE